jgi:sortase (surface protein transpeptidase)
MKKYNISKPEKYLKDGEEKTYWANVGTMTEFEKEGKVSRIIEIPAIGLKANIFEIKKDDKKDEQSVEGY